VKRRIRQELETLYRLRAQQFARLAWAITGDRELARDALQDGFARALLRQDSFRGQGDLAAWVARIVANAAQDIVRRRSDELRYALAKSETELEISEGDSRLRIAVASLPERQRLAVFFRYYADLDYAQIAAALGIERGTVSATLNAAHKKLAAVLAQEVPR
jgi:RNA polymerase sigma-70 factor (ECF subfamily)